MNSFKQISYEKEIKVEGIPFGGKLVVNIREGSIDLFINHERYDIFRFSSEADLAYAEEQLIAAIKRQQERPPDMYKDPEFLIKKGFKRV